MHAHTRTHTHTHTHTHTRTHAHTHTLQGPKQFQETRKGQLVPGLKIPLGLTV